MQEATVTGDVYAIVTSSAMIRGALEAMSDDTAPAYFPGKGLLLSAEWVGDIDLPRMVANVRDIVLGLSGTVRELGPDETVSVAWLGGPSGGPEWHQVVAAMRPGAPASLVVRVDGRIDGSSAMSDIGVQSDHSREVANTMGQGFQDALLSSAALLRGAVAGVSDRVRMTYGAGEGLLMQATWLGRIDVEQIQRDFVTLLRGLGHRVADLPSSEWITIEWVGRRPGEKILHRVLARMRPGDLESVEVSAVEEAWDD